MRLVNLLVNLDEVAPRVVWSDDLGAWGDSATAGGSRWISPGVVQVAGSSVVLADGVVDALGCDWVALDPLSPSAIMVDLVSDGGRIAAVPLLPGAVLSVPKLVEVRIVAAPEQSDVARVRMWLGAGVCPVASFGGAASVPGKPQAVMLRGAPDTSGLTISRTVLLGAVFGPGSVTKLTSWSGRRFAGGSFQIIFAAFGAVDFLVGPDAVAPAGVPAVGGVVDAAGYTWVGSASGGAAVQNYARCELRADVGVSVGYPGSQALYMRGTTLQANAATSVAGSILLRGGDQ